MSTTCGISPRLSSNIRDESDRRGMHLVIELKRGEIPQVVLNQLYKHTNLQTSVSILMLGLLDNVPLVFTLRELLQHFLAHRRQVVYKRTFFDLEKSKAREHLLAGFIVALQNIDEVVAIVKQSKSFGQWYLRHCCWYGNFYSTAQSW